MAEETKTSYEMLLEQIDNLKKESESIRKEFNDLRDFNRALIARNGSNANKQANSDDISKKFESYLKGE